MIWSDKTQICPHRRCRGGVLEPFSNRAGRQKVHGTVAFCRSAQHRPCDCNIGSSRGTWLELAPPQLCPFLQLRPKLRPAWAQHGGTWRVFAGISHVLVSMTLQSHHFGAKLSKVAPCWTWPGHPRAHLDRFGSNFSPIYLITLLARGWGEAPNKLE